MGDKLTERDLASFAEALAARESVPGGGGAAAYAGALAAALTSMVGRFTVGKRRYAEVEDDVRRMVADADALRGRLVALIDADAAAFLPLSRAYAIPREDPARAEVLEEATRRAAEPPLEMVRACAEVVAVLEEMGEKGSRMLASDVACGAHLARAAMGSAAVNVYVNTGSLADRDLAARLERECDEALAEWASRAEALAARVTASIRGRG